MKTHYYKFISRLSKEEAEIFDKIKRLLLYHITQLFKKPKEVNEAYCDCQGFLEYFSMNKHLYEKDNKMYVEKKIQRYLLKDLPPDFFGSETEKEITESLLDEMKKYQNIVQLTREATHNYCIKACKKE